MQSKINNKKIKLKLWVRFLIALFILLCILSSILIIKIGFDNKNKLKEEYIYSYDINENIDYKVYLYDNSFIDEEYLTQGNMFVSELVKNIEILFNYNFVGNKEIDLEYDYSIIGNLTGNYTNGTDSNNNVWSKKYNFLNSKDNIVKDSLRAIISEKFIFNFPEFNSEVKAFKNKFGILINSKIEIVFQVNIRGKIDDQEINDIKKASILIPLGIQAFSITEDYLPSFKNNITKELNHIGANKTIYIGLFLFLISILLFLSLYRIIFNIIKQTNYNKKLNRILKNYGEVIVEINTSFDEKKYKVIEVKNIEEMVDLEQELRIPINYYEIIKDNMGAFIIVNNDLLYKYVLTDEK